MHPLSGVAARMSLRDDYRLLLSKLDPKEYNRLRAAGQLDEHLDLVECEARKYLIQLNEQVARDDLQGQVMVKELVRDFMREFMPNVRR